MSLIGFCLQSDRGQEAVAPAEFPMGVTGDTAMGKTPMSAATHGHEQALRMEAGFLVGSTSTVLDEAMQ